METEVLTEATPSTEATSSEAVPKAAPSAETTSSSWDATRITSIRTSLLPHLPSITKTT